MTFRTVAGGQPVDETKQRIWQRLAHRGLETGDGILGWRWKGIVALLTAEADGELQRG